VRLVVLVKLDAAKSADFTYAEVNAAIWTTIEPTVAIATICIPSLRLFFRREGSQPNPVTKSVAGSAQRNTSVESGDEMVQGGKLPSISNAGSRHDASSKPVGDTHRSGTKGVSFRE